MCIGFHQGFVMSRKLRGGLWGMLHLNQVKESRLPSHVLFSKLSPEFWLSLATSSLQTSLRCTYSGTAIDGLTFWEDHRAGDEDVVRAPEYFADGRVPRVHTILALSLLAMSSRVCRMLPSVPRPDRIRATLVRAAYEFSVEKWRFAIRERGVHVTD